MSANQILFIINGLGLGNSTRCEAVMTELQQMNFEIDIITSGNGIQFFKNKKLFHLVAEFSSLNYGRSQQQISILKTFLSFPILIGNYFLNVKKLKNVLNQKNYSAVVFDSDYTVASLLFKKRPVLIAINNAAEIIKTLKKENSIPSKIRNQFFIEKLDALFHRLVPDLLISPWFENTNSLIVRQSLYPKKKAQSPLNVLVMLSGSQFGTDIKFIQSIQIAEIQIQIIGGSEKNKLEDNRAILNAADILVINAGFSAVCEAIVLCKPAVVIPIEKHAEQYVNALLFQKCKFGLVATQENIQENLERVVQDFDFFKSNLVKNVANKSGAREAALQITEHLMKPREQLV